MRAQRIKMVFHRAGLLLAAMFWLPGACLATWTVSGLAIQSATNIANVVRLFVFGTALYVICVGIGRLAAAFIGPERSN